MNDWNEDAGAPAQHTLPESVRARFAEAERHHRRERLVSNIALAVGGLVLAAVIAWTLWRFV